MRSFILSSLSIRVSARFTLLNQRGNLAIKSSILIQQRDQSLVRHQEGRAQWHRPRTRAGNNSTANAAHLFDPPGKVPRVSDCSREQQHANPGRRQNDRFFPDVSALFIGKIVRFIEDHQIRVNFFTAAQRIEKLIPIDLGGSHDQRRVGILFPIAGENADAIGPERCAELGIL
jgi:hypothetical protein